MDKGDWVLRAAVLGAMKDPSLDELLDLIPHGRVNAVEMAQIIHKSYPTVLKMIKDGRIEAFRIGGQWAIPAEEVHRVLAQGTDRAPG